MLRPRPVPANVFSLQFLSRYIRVYPRPPVVQKKAKSEMLKAKTGNSILVCFVFFVVKNPCSSVIKPLYVFAPRNVPDLFCWQGHRAAMTGQHAVLALIAPGRRPAPAFAWFVYFVVYQSVSLRRIWSGHFELSFFLFWL